MTEQRPAAEAQPEEHIIREDNWFDYQARGFFRLRSGTREELEAWLGVENVYPGDAWDEEAGRPLRHKPGTSYYSNEDGLEYDFQRWREMSRGQLETEWRRRYESAYDPPAS